MYLLLNENAIFGMDDIFVVFVLPRRDYDYFKMVNNN